MIFTDKAPIGEVRRTGDGYMVADVRVARTGIQIYTGAELGIPDRQTIRVFRPEAEVFAGDAMKSFAHRPVTMDHPSENVSSKNWRDLAIGNTGGEVVRDGEFVRVPLVLMDEAAIKRVESGTKELSMGYSASLELKDGVTPSGEPYDAVMKDMRMNHLAVVPQARGGSELKIGDKTTDGGQTMDPKLKTVVVDGLTITVTDQGAEIINKLQNQITQLNDAATRASTEHSAELARKDAEIDSLKGKILTDAQIEARVAQRSAFVATAKRLLPTVVVDGKSDLDVKRQILVAKFGDAAITGKDDAYIAVRFDILAEDAARTDPVQQTLRQGVVPSAFQPSVADKAYMEERAAEAEAWKPAYLKGAK